MKCLILAAGFGTRLYPLGIKKAKALLEYEGKPLLTHIVDKIPQGMDLLISTNKKFEAAIRRWRKTIDRPVEICVENVWTEEQKMGAIGGLNFWINQKNIAEDLLVTAGDNYFEFDLSRFIAAYNGKNSLVAVYDIGDLRRASQFGVVRLVGCKIIELQEKPTKPRSSLIATACYIFPLRVFHLLSRYCSEGKRDNLGDFISYLIETDEVYGYPFSELWFDIGSRH